MGPTASVFLKQKATTAQLIDLANMLSEIADEVIHTRKGRVWNVVISTDSTQQASPKPQRHLYDISIEDTQAKEELYEEEIFGLGYLSSDLPEVIEFSSRSNSEFDYKMLNHLSEKTLSIFDGISTEPEK